jgi:hypothetical protein
VGVGAAAAAAAAVVVAVSAAAVIIFFERSIEGKIREARRGNKNRI